MGTTQDDLREIMAKAQSETPPETQAPAPVAPSAPAAQGGDGDSDGGPQRSPDGRFAPKNAATVEPGSEQPAPVTPSAPAQPTAPATLDITQPPRGWRPEFKAGWDALPKETREEIMRREEAAMQGVQRLQEQHKPAAELHRNIAQYEPYFQHIKAEPIAYLNDVIRTEQTLTLGNPAQKMDMLLALADRYGVPLRQTLDTAMGGKLAETMRASHERFKTPPTVPPEVQQELNEMRQWRATLENQAVQQELKAVTDNPEKFPFFDEIREKMAAALDRGVVETYEEAYDFVIFRDPALRQRQAAHEAGLAQRDAVRQRQQAAGGLRLPAQAPIGSESPDGLDSDDVYSVVKAAMSAGTGRV